MASVEVDVTSGLLDHCHCSLSPLSMAMYRPIAYSDSDELADKRVCHKVKHVAREKNKTYPTCRQHGKHKEKSGGVWRGGGWQCQ